MHFLGHHERRTNFRANLHFKTAKTVSYLSESFWATENDVVGQIWPTGLRFDTVSRCGKERKVQLLRLTKGLIHAPPR